MQQSAPIFGPVLIVEDQRECWRPLKAELLTSGLFARVLIAQNISEAESRLENLGSLAAVLMDACLRGDEPDTLDLTREMRETYDGIIIAMSRDPAYRQRQLHAGCSHETSKENAAAYLIDLMLRSA